MTSEYIAIAKFEKHHDDQHCLDKPGHLWLRREIVSRNYLKMRVNALMAEHYGRTQHTGYCCFETPLQHRKQLLHELIRPVYHVAILSSITSDGTKLVIFWGRTWTDTPSTRWAPRVKRRSNSSASNRHVSHTRPGSTWMGCTRQLSHVQHKALYCSSLECKVAIEIDCLPWNIVLLMTTLPSSCTALRVTRNSI